MKKLPRSFISLFTLGLMVSAAPSLMANGTVKSKESCAPKIHHKNAHATPHAHHAKECCVPPSLFATGFYGGAMVGWSHMRAKLKNQFVLTEPADFAQNTTLRKSKSSDSVVGELFLGGRYLFCDDLTAGLEVAGDLDNHSEKNTFEHDLARFQVKFKHRFTLIPSLVVGKVFACNVHGFIKLGVGISRFKTDLFNLDDQTSFKKNKTKYGFVPAVGLEYAVNHCISVLGTVSYEKYQQIKSNFSNVVLGPEFITSDTAKVRPRFMATKLGVLIKI